MKILVFTEGTVLMYPSAERLTREERVEQSKTRDKSVYDFKNHVPNGNAVEKIKFWKDQGADIYYLTSRRTFDEVNDIKNVLYKYNFPDNDNLLFRKEGEEYKDVAEKLIPDVLVEDDCESIGGEVEMTYPYVREDIKNKIKPIIVKEFGGIDHLPDNINQLLALT
jgi:uncharacterized protein YnzC (UPF0291/DUF896 family)